MPYDVGNDPYLDPDTGILRNLLGMKTQADLDAAEARVTSVEVSKGGTSFARMQHLDTSLEEIFRKLERDDCLVGLGTDEFVEKLARYYGDFIVAHPFREGNGRAIRTFLGMLADSVGWHIAWDEMKPDENIQASISAYKGDEKPMHAMLGKIVTPLDVFWGRDPYEFI